MRAEITLKEKEDEDMMESVVSQAPRSVFLHVCLSDFSLLLGAAECLFALVACVFAHIL